jgi:hypothetical protein
MITYESKLLFEFELTKPEADNTVKDVTQEAYFAHGLHRAKNGVGQSLTNSLLLNKILLIRKSKISYYYYYYYLKLLFSSEYTRNKNSPSI